MNESKKGGGGKRKTQILNRVLNGRKLLLERGFNATLIETEDLHVRRRSMDDIINSKIKE